VESAGIPDLDGLDDGPGVRRLDLAGRGGTEAESKSVRMDVVLLNEVRLLADRSQVEVEAASNRLEVRIDEFTKHDLLQRVLYL
jgi:hypothetical protein